MVVGAAAVAGYVERRAVGRFGCGGLWLSVVGRANCSMEPVWKWQGTSGVVSMQAA